MFKQDELLLEDIWTLLRAGRLGEASEQGSTSRTGAVAVSAVPVSRPDSKTRDRSGNAGNWSETPETARFPVPGLHREITSRREVKPWSPLQYGRTHRGSECSGAHILVRESPFALLQRN